MLFQWQGMLRDTVLSLPERPVSVFSSFNLRAGRVPGVQIFSISCSFREILVLPPQGNPGSATALLKVISMQK